MKLNFHPTRAAVLVGAALLSATFAFPAMAAGGASGPKVAYMAQGNIGEVMVNPYRIAPLTAVIRSGGYVVFCADRPKAERSGNSLFGV